MNTGPDFGGLCWICHFGNHFAFSSDAGGEPWESTEQQSVQNRLFGLIVWKVKVSIGKDSFSNLFLKLRNRIPASKCLWNRYYLLIKWNRRNFIKFMSVSNPWSILLLNLLIWSKSNFYWLWFSIGKKFVKKYTLEIWVILQGYTFEKAIPRDGVRTKSGPEKSGFCLANRTQDS